PSAAGLSCRPLAAGCCTLKTLLIAGVFMIYLSARLLFARQASRRVFIHLLLIALVFLGLLRLGCALGQCSVRHALAFAFLPCPAFTLDDQTGIADRRLLTDDRLFQFADELLEIGIGGGG